MAQRNFNSIYRRPTTTKEVFNCIKELKLKTTPDEIIPSHFLRIASQIFSPYLSELFNYCMLFDVLPQVLETAKLSPIFKSGCRTSTRTNNYRPISLFFLVFPKYLKKLCHQGLRNFSTKVKYSPLINLLRN